MCRENHLGIILKYKKALTRNVCFTQIKMTSSFVGYFFVPGPLGGLKSVPGDISDMLIPLAPFS